MADFKGPVHVQPVADQQVGGFSDFVTVQGHSYGITLGFFQMQLPTFENPNDPGFQEFQRNPVVQALLVGKIVLPKEQAKRLLELLSKQLGKLDEPEGG